MEEEKWNRLWIPILRNNMLKDVRIRLQVPLEIELVVFSEEEFYFTTDIGGLIQKGRQQMVVVVPDMPEAGIWDDLQTACVRRYYYPAKVQLFVYHLNRAYWAFLLDWSPESSRRAQSDSQQWMEIDENQVPHWSTRSSRRRDRRSRHGR